MDKCQLYIMSRGQVFECAVEEGVVWETHRTGVPGKLTFNVVKDDILAFYEGDLVQFNYDGNKIFSGFIFTKKRKNNRIISVIAYDQLRYFKNKDTYVYSNKTASELLKKIASDFKLTIGKVEDTTYKISRTEDDQELFSIIYNALDETTKNTGEIFVLYDDYGALCLQNVKTMRTNILIDEESGKSFEYTTSIDEATYNKIKLVRDNKEKKVREIYIAEDGEKQSEWGVLQYYEMIDENVNAQAKANALLKLYNKKSRKLHINKVFGDARVRGGTTLAVKMNLGDLAVANFMMVETVKHTFKESDHRMDLKLVGGDFIA